MPYVTKFGGGRHTSVAWFRTFEEASRECDRLFRCGAWSGGRPRVERDDTTSGEAVGLFVRIEEAATLPGEPKAWIVLFNGVQQGGMYDKSGAGNRTFKSTEEAEEWVAEILRGVPFQREPRS